MQDNEWKKNIHHRKPKSIGGGNTGENLSRVLVRHHVAWHVLFKNYEAEAIASIINDVWLDSDYEFIVRRRK